MSTRRRLIPARLRRVRRLIGAQAAVAVSGVIIALMLAGRPAAIAAALGGLICLVPQAGFAWRVFGADPGDPAATIRALYAGEGMKLATVALAFVALFLAWPQVPMVPLILVFIAVQAVHWFAPLLLET